MTEKDQSLLSAAEFRAERKVTPTDAVMIQIKAIICHVVICSLSKTIPAIAARAGDKLDKVP